MTGPYGIQFILSIITLLTVIFGVFKVVVTAQRGVDAHEKRIAVLETKIDARSSQLESINVSLYGLSSKFELLEQEMKRIRDRVDRFLDGQSAKAESMELILEALKRGTTPRINIEP